MNNNQWPILSFFKGFWKNERLEQSSEGGRLALEQSQQEINEDKQKMESSGVIPSAVHGDPFLSLSRVAVTVRDFFQGLSNLKGLIQVLSLLVIWDAGGPERERMLNRLHSMTDDELALLISCGVVDAKPRVGDRVRDEVVPEDKKFIGFRFFADQVRLRSVEFRSKDSQLGDQVFSGCLELRKVIFHAEGVISLGTNLFEGVKPGLLVSIVEGADVEIERLQVPGGRIEIRPLWFMPALPYHDQPVKVFQSIHQSMGRFWTLFMLQVFRRFNESSMPDTNIPSEIMLFILSLAAFPLRTLSKETRRERVFPLSEAQRKRLAIESEPWYQAFSKASQIESAGLQY